MPWTVRAYRMTGAGEAMVPSFVACHTHWGARRLARQLGDLPWEVRIEPYDPRIDGEGLLLPMLEIVTKTAATGAIATMWYLTVGKYLSLLANVIIGPAIGIGVNWVVSSVRRGFE